MRVRACENPHDHHRAAVVSPWKTTCGGHAASCVNQRGRAHRMTTITEPLRGDIRTIEWNDAWTQLDGISEKTMREHWKLYEGYVGKWKAIEEQLKGVDLSAANQI